jgi:CDP-glucose 4,6-dehydratase
MVIDHAFWRHRRVLVTGHTGFKGAWISLWLQRLGAELTGFALAPATHPSLFEVARVANGMDSIAGDVRDLRQLTSALAKSRAEVIIHMAAQSLVRTSYADPVTTYSTNVMGTVNILESARKQDTVRVVLNITSDKCYENREWLWGYRENEAMGGADPYSSSKGCSELVTAAYRRAFFSTQAPPVAVASARAGNVVGGGDWAADRLVPDFFRAAESGKTLVVRNPAAIRPWQHVLEPLCGYITLVQALWKEPQQFSGPWNFGPSVEDDWPVRKVVESLVRLTPIKVSWGEHSETQPHEARYLKLDSAKARALLGWAPRMSVERTLKATVEWFSQYQSRAEMRFVTEAQIGAYEDPMSNAS